MGILMVRFQMFGIVLRQSELGLDPSLPSLQAPAAAQLPGPATTGLNPALWMSMTFIITQDIPRVPDGDELPRANQILASSLVLV